MGKYSWKKHSYVRVEDDHPGCIWTVFHMLNYHPWHNVRKMLTYKKHKPHGSPSKNKGIRSDEEHEIMSITHEMEEDYIMKYSASVNSNTSKNGSRSKRSIKARIRALMKEKNSSTKSDLIVDDDYDDKNAPSLMALLKANPKLIRSASRTDNQDDIKKPETKDSKKDEFVGVLELFNVDQDLFIKILQDTSPRKPRLIKSGTFPSRNPTNYDTKPSKVEHKHTEIWPLSSNVHELRKAKSQGTMRSSSLTESLGRFGYLFDISSHKAIKKHLSKSTILMNEKEFGLLGDYEGERSVKERFDLSEIESHSFSVSKTLLRDTSERRNNDEREGEVRELRLDSTKGCEKLVELKLEKENWYNFEEVRSYQQTNDEVQSQEGEIQVTESSISEELQPMLNITSTSFKKREYSKDSMDYCNEDLQYVKYVVDIVDLATLETQHKAWHSQFQPLDPALFDGIEICCPFKPKSSNKDTNSNMSSSHRKFLFDLINEALVNIHDKSYIYYPKSLSYWCQVKEKIFNVEQVWKLVEDYLSWRPELDPLLDLAVANDLSRHKNGWVNLEMDTEDLALELEDWIFDDLLDEFVG